MSKVTNCCACKYYNMQENNCIKYTDGVPEDVFVEIIKCEEYCGKEIKEDKDIPTVKRIPGSYLYEVTEN